jgi:Ni,Fe-hydrogenase III large subunit/Ni,Fe-hydrogenase III component G
MDLDFLITSIGAGVRHATTVLPDALVQVSHDLRAEGAADLLLMMADDRRADTGTYDVHYVWGYARQRSLVQVTVSVDASVACLPSIATVCYPASRFEREIQDLFGITFDHHPDPRPLVRHGFWPDGYFPLRKGEPVPESFEDDGRPFPVMKVGGEGVYEIPVGPVHAGVIEPGHFRFSVMGETIIDVKSRLYFTHKGTEKLFEGRHAADGIELAERVSGDTSVGHALAYAQAVEQAAGIEVPRAARRIRVILLELERLYNHIGDFGGIANDTGYALAHAHCLRIRERLLRLNKALTGSRLLRGLVEPGGVARGFPAGIDVVCEVESALADFEDVVKLTLANTLVADRLDGAGVLSREQAEAYGVLGFVGRAAGRDIDTRRDRPFAAYDELDVRVPVFSRGDVMARTQVRVEEVRESASLIRRVLNSGLDGALQQPVGAFDPARPAFGMVEGWRGRIVHAVRADEGGVLARVKIVDPSFFNWPALARALQNNIVPDFPLCNKSFNQSYSGNDL